MLTIKVNYSSQREFVRNFLVINWLAVNNFGKMLYFEIFESALHTRMDFGNVIISLASFFIHIIYR